MSLMVKDFEHSSYSYWSSVCLLLRTLFLICPLIDQMIWLDGILIGWFAFLSFKITYIFYILKLCLIYCWQDFFFQLCKLSLVFFSVQKHFNPCISTGQFLESVPELVECFACVYIVRLFIPAFSVPHTQVLVPLRLHFCAEWEMRVYPHSSTDIEAGFFEHPVWRRLPFLKYMFLGVFFFGTFEEERENRWLSLGRFISGSSISLVHVCSCAEGTLIFFCDLLSFEISIVSLLLFFPLHHRFDCWAVGSISACAAV